jgi:hypothetical protein
VEIDREFIHSREAHLKQLWLSDSDFADADVRPAAVRNALLTPGWRSIRHLAVVSWATRDQWM